MKTQSGPGQQHQPVLRISFLELKRLVTQIGRPNRWRIEYGDYPSLANWIRQHIHPWPTGDGITLFGLPLYKRAYVKAGQIRVVNEITEVALTIDIQTGVVV